MAAGASLQLARHAVETPWEALPPEATSAARRSLLDAIGVTLAAGTLEPACRPFVESTLADGGRPESSILGFDARVPAPAAAFANGSLAHALDFEDAHDEARVHPYAPTVAAALAVAQARGDVTGRELIAALALGSDIVCRLGLALLDDPVKRGWYMAPILGAFGATAAAGRLRGLSTDQMVQAFSITLCQATCSADSAADPDSTIRAVRDAFAARAGVLSARLVGLGTRGFTNPFEGAAGLFELYAAGEYDLARLTDGLGVEFEGARVSYKPWPCCRGTHAHIEATIGLVSANDMGPEEISGIRLGLEDLPVMRLLSAPIEGKRRPQTAIDAKFSLPFTVAVAAVQRDVSLDAFSERGLRDERVLSVSQSTDCETVAATPRSPVGFVEIATHRGRFRARTPESVLGSPGNPLGDDALVAKFRRCAEHAPTPLEKDHLDRVIDLVMEPEGRSTVDDWVSLLCPTQPSRSQRTWKEDDGAEC